VSLLLDALRKSEQQRRLGETPRIQLSGTASLEKSRKKLPLLLIGLVIVVGSLLAWLFLLQRSADPIELPGIAQTMPEGSQRAVQLVENQQQTLASPGAPATSAQVTSGFSQQGADEPLLSALNDENAGQPLNDFDQLAERIAKQQALIKQQAEIENSGASLQPEVVAAKIAVEEATHKQPIPVAEEQWQPKKPNFISYFELPVEVRQKLPELPITIRVFDAIASKRFVVINHERLQEGDILGGAEGVRLIEIKRDSLVLEYQGYIFEYE